MSKVNFTIDLESLTTLVREKQADNDQAWLKSFAKAQGFNAKIMKLILGGKLKMVNDDNGGGLLIEDNWQPYDHYEWYGGWLKPDNVEDNKKYTGWITPNGFFYYTPFRSHLDFLSKFNLSETEAELQGWVKIRENYELAYHPNHIPNKKQQKTLLKWCKANGYEFPKQIDRILCYKLKKIVKNSK